MPVPFFLFAGRESGTCIQRFYIQTAIVKWMLVVVLAVTAFTSLSAQTTFGSSSGSETRKLYGVTYLHVQGGYIAISVPPKDVERLITVMSVLEPHVEAFELLERLNKEANRISAYAPPSPQAVPFGAVFLETDEFFPERHKALDRFVQYVGMHSFLNRRGQVFQLREYVGGPGRFPN